MTNLIRSEWVKLRSVRSTMILLVAAGALVVFFAVIAANHRNGEQAQTCTASPDATTTTVVQPDPNLGPGDGEIQQGFACPPGSVLTEVPITAHLGDVTVGVTVAIFLFGTLGVQVIGQEYRFNTIRPTFTAAPRRLRVLAAKLVVVTISAAVVSAIMLAVCAVIGSVMLDRFEIDSTDQRVVWATMLFAMGWTMYGMGLGAVLRQPIAAIVILLVQGLIAEPLLAINIKALGPWVPFQNGVQMTGREPSDPEIFRSITAGGVYFFLFTFVLWGIGAYLVNRRDA